MSFVNVQAPVLPVVVLISPERDSFAITRRTKLGLAFTLFCQGRRWNALAGMSTETRHHMYRNRELRIIHIVMVKDTVTKCNINAEGLAASERASPTAASAPRFRGARLRLAPR